jgi:hypothetical protein
MSSDTAQPAVDLLQLARMQPAPDDEAQSL